MSANKNQLDNFIIIIDFNKSQSYGSTNSVCPLEPFSDKWSSFGFDVAEVDMVNSPQELLSTLQAKRNKPLAIICHTIKGQGNSFLENNLSWHHKNNITQKDIDHLQKHMK